jgi:predicted lipoprotein
MASRFAACLLLAIPIFASMPAQAQEKAAIIVREAIDGFILPAHREFRQQSAELWKSMNGLCEAPSTQQLDRVRRAFTTSVDGWSRIEIIRFGPITQQNRLERMLFWPDRKSIGLKQVQKILASRDSTVLDSDQLAKKSVAVQGLGALEFVLFGTDSDSLSSADDLFRCRYGEAVAHNINVIAERLDDEWSDNDSFAFSWANPGPDNPLYRDGTEAVTELMRVFVTGMELVRDVRLGGFFSKEAKNDKPRQALFWRSGKTVDALAGNLAGMKALLEASKLAEALPAGQAWMGKEALFEFGNAANAASAADGPIADVLADPEKRSKLAYFGLVTSSLSNIFGTQMSGALGLTAGFSSLDGD